ALLQVADAGDVLVEPVAVVRADLRAQRSGLVADVIQDASAVPESVYLGPDFVGPAVEEKPGEHLRRRRGRGHERAGPGPGEAGALARQGQAWESRAATDMFGRELIDRDRVPEPGASGPLHPGQEAGRGLVGEPRTHPGMRQARHHREVAAELLEHAQVRRE